MRSNRVKQALLAICLCCGSTALAQVTPDSSQGDTQSRGIRLAEEEFEGLKKKNGEGDPQVIALQDRLANLYFDSRLYEKSQKAFDSLSKSYAAKHGDNDPLVWERLFKFGQSCRFAGDYEKAESTFLDIASRAEKKLGAGHQTVALYLEHAAQVQGEMTNYQLCIATMTKAMETYKIAVGSDSTDVARTMNTLANARMMLNDWAEAEHLNKQASDMILRLANSDGGKYKDRMLAKAEILMTSAVILRDQPDGIPAALEAIAAAEAILIELKEDKQLAELLKIRANINKNAKNFSEAEQDARNALAAFRNATRTPSGSFDPEQFVYLQRLSEILLVRYYEFKNKDNSVAREKLDEAKIVLEQAIDVNLNHYQRENSWLPHMYLALGSIEKRLGLDDQDPSTYAESRKWYQKALESRLQYIESQILALDETQAFESVAPFRDNVILHFLVTNKIKDEQAQREFYESMWKTKGLVARLIQQQTKTFRRFSNADSVDLVNQRMEVSDELAKRTLSRALTAQGDINEINELRARVSALTGRLATCDDLPVTMTLNLPLSGLQQSLPPDVAIVDVIEIKRRDAINQPMQFEYHAYIITRDAGADNIKINHVVLNQRIEIEEKIEEWIKDLNIGAEKGVKQKQPSRMQLNHELTAELKTMTWDKLQPALGGRKHAIFCTDGVLSKLPWPALPGENGHDYLIRDYTFSYVPNAQFVLKLLTAPEVQSTGMLAIGDVDYGKQGDTTANSWQKLNGTLDEIQQIAEIGKGSFETQMLTGREATEANFVKAVVGKRYVLISTHGFAIELVDDRADVVLGRNPFALNGLVLAGANDVPHPIQNGQPFDQLFTGQEAMNLDLHDSELFVLSACVSGAGKIMAGEGVFGIQQALHWAGVRSTLASRWNLASEPAAAVTATFFKNMLGGKSKAESLQAAMIERIDAGDPPNLWASWKLDGDWR